MIKCPLCEMPQSDIVGSMIARSLAVTSICAIKKQTETLKKIQEYFLKMSLMTESEKSRELENIKQFLDQEVKRNDQLVNDFESNAVDFLTPMREAFLQVARENNNA
jgi:predicted tellurium resistance membrane protein TerC